MRKFICLIGLVFLFNNSMAFAGDGEYVKGNIGIFMSSDFDVEIQNFKIGEAESETGVGFSVALGQSVGNGFDVEAEFAYRTADIEDSDFDVDVKTLMVNGIYNFNKAATVNPYVGAGLGIGWMDIDDFSGSAFSYQFLAGVAIGFTDNLSGLFGYRYVGTSDAEDDFNGLEVSTNLSSHNLEVGLKYSF